MPTQIPLSGGEFAVIDDADSMAVSSHTWRVQKQYYLGQKLGVAAVVSKVSGITTTLHQFLLGKIEGMVIDHIDGNPLNNTRANLRRCTQAQNLRNRKMASHNTCGSKGVFFDRTNPGKRCNRWRARITLDGRRINIGRFATQHEAAKAYQAAAQKYHREFARAAA